jgi:hypothetical protein
MTRRGIMCTASAFLLCTAALSCLAVAVSIDSQRGRGLAAREARIAGREWCLGAGAIAPGATLTCGAWRITHGRDGSVQADGPAGSFSIDAAGRERWTTRRRGGP